MSSVENLSEDRRRTLLSKLIKGGDLDGLGNEFALTVPKRMTVQFQCPNCDKEFSNRLMTKDMEGMRKYVRCPECKKKAYLSDIGAPKEAARISEDPLGDFFEN